MLYNGNPCFKNQLDTGDDREWVKDLAEGQKFRMYDSRGRFVGVYEYQDSRHWWKPGRCPHVASHAAPPEHLEQRKNEEVTG